MFGDIICGLEFNNVHVLKIHMLTHMPIECPVCPYWGATCDAMRKHFAKVHQTTETEGSDIDSSGEMTRYHVQSQ